MRNILIVSFIALMSVWLLVGCIQLTPTVSPLPTLSPLLPQVMQAWPEPRTLAEDPPTEGSVELYWGDVLVVGDAIDVELYDSREIGSTTVISYRCEPSNTIACANYPFTRTVPTADLLPDLAFTFTTVLDLEARSDTTVLDTDTQPMPFVSKQEPGVGQENDSVPWMWSPEIPIGYFGTVEIWERIRGIDTDDNLPDVYVPYFIDVNDELLQHDQRGFFLKSTYDTEQAYIIYMPIVARGN